MLPERHTQTSRLFGKSFRNYTLSEIISTCIRRQVTLKRNGRKFWKTKRKYCKGRVKQLNISQHSGHPNYVFNRTR